MTPTCLCSLKDVNIISGTDNDDCDEGLAIYSDTLNWAAANDSCSLIKLTNESDLTDYDNLHYSEQYWIGLRRHRYIGWIGRKFTCLFSFLLCHMHFIPVTSAM